MTPLKGRGRLPGRPGGGLQVGRSSTREALPLLLGGRQARGRVARFHNIYGPLGTYEGGREKAPPAAISRKVALADDGADIEIWGDGQRTHSFTYIDDCVEGIYRIAQSDHWEPLNLGSDRLVTIDQLVDLVSEVAGKTLVKQHDLTKPQGVRGRNSDNDLCKETLGWAPEVTLEDGLKSTYAWIEGQLEAAAAANVGERVSTELPRPRGPP